MSRRTEAPFGFECPYRHNCPHLDHLSTTWTLEVYQDIVLVPRTLVTRFVHRQSYGPRCRHPVYQAGPGEVPGA